MDEMSSLDSYQTTEDDTAAEADAVAVAEDDNVAETDAAAAAATDEKDEAAKEDDEDFDAISDGTFDVDENSQVASNEAATDDAPPKADSPADAETNSQATEKSPSPEEAAEQPTDTRDDSQKSADFEEVNAEVAAEAVAEESDLLGDADATLPAEKSKDMDEEDEPEADKASTPNSSMDVDPEAPQESLAPQVDEARREEEAENDEAEPMEADESIEEGDKTSEEKDAEERRPQEADDKEAEEERDAEGENDAEGKEPAETDKDKDNDPSAVMEVDNDEGDQEDEPAENVQEPEESDNCIMPDEEECLIPDDDAEVTEADKEQAILARENAEKELEQAEKDRQKDSDLEGDSEKAKSDDKRGASGEDTADKDSDVELVDDRTEQVATSAAPTTASEDPAASKTPASVRGSSEEPGEDSSKAAINWIVSAKETCAQCKEEKTCDFRFTDPDSGQLGYLCQQECCDAFVAGDPDKYCMRLKKFLIEEVTAAESDDDHDCMQCKDPRPCKYFFRQDEEVFYVCSDDCFGLLNAIEPDKFQLKRHSIRVRNIGGSAMMAASGKESSGERADGRLVSRSLAEAEAARHERAASFVRRCGDCLAEIELDDDKHLQWETLDFCNEQCLGKFQRARGSSCETCGGQVSDAALGKYSVRFGFDLRQFCCAACLNEYKKGLKTCSCCQKDISSGSEGFLAPVGDKEQFKDFCSQACMRHYDAMCNPRKKVVSDHCAVCNNLKPVQVEIVLDGKEHTFCSNPCFSAFKFVSNVVADQCGMCSKYFERKGDESFTIYMERRAKVFCTRICLNVYIITNRCIVSCQWCKVKKYNFDMIYKQSDKHELLMCSLNCLTLYGMSINAFTRTAHKCDSCNVANTPQYHLTMSDGSMRNFCTYQCVMQFQSQFGRTPLMLEEAAAGQEAAATVPFPTGLPKRAKLKSGYGQGGAQQTGPPPLTPLSQKRPSAKASGPAAGNKSVLPIISNVASLASGETSTVIAPTSGRGRGRGRPPGSGGGRGRGRRNAVFSRSPSPPPSPYPPSLPPPLAPHDTEAGPAETRIITVPPYPPTVRNVQTSCRPQTQSFGCQTEPATTTTGTQTEKDYSNKVLIPVPVPIFIPTPMYMYSAPFPVPVPIPLPIPVPVFIPTTRNSAEGILKEIKKIQDKMPADPFEAELLMMAEMVAEEKNEDDSDSGDEIKPEPGIVNLQYTNSVPQQQQQPQQAATQHVEVPNHSYGEDVLQMALKMATGEYDQPTVDLETAMQANTITNPPPGIVDDSGIVHIGTHHIQDGAQHIILETPQRSGRGRKRGSLSTSPGTRLQRSPAKRARISEIDEAAAAVNQPLQVQPTGEKPDANLCLKYTFGVNAWKQWVMTKNTDIEKNATRRRPFKTELLQMTADELNYSLCLFVKEVRKPNGTEYAPDTIYYLVLGIQQYLYENGRIDNIFTDVFYERFTDCLDEVARRFSVLYNDSQYIVTRVEEEHLWECKQLGAHSPHVLLSTLMFFNTKHFNLTTVEEHMQLSFSHIMKHWKRSSQNAKNPGTRNVLLRFYPPQAGLDTNPRKKKVYEQQENEENPLRCPVRLYEFYLSKCPESVKTRNDVFYLQPERSCVPDSPVWYSTQALSRDSLEKMLHRVKMVKEINIALLTS